MEVTDEELTAVITKQLSAMNPPLTMEAYRRMIESKGGNFEVLKAAHARELKYHKLFEAKVTGSLTTTEEDARKYYDGNPEDFRVPERVRASHILISTEPTDPNADPNQAKVQARQKAEELLKKVKDGEDFAALAKENSACPSKTQGGDLGMFGRDQMVPPFEEAAFALKAGEVSGLVETQFGYHIIKVTEHQDPNQVPFEKIKDRIIDQLTQQKRNEAIRTYVDALRQNAKISYSTSGAPAAPQASQPVITPQAPADANNKR
ncbi:MAG: hypothetical protein A2Y76_03160 [Planctomycetes bacterium RBG_13_60_9]|nr:MAG: hypothetical protein A2Y76_03160 [Planctomycetes bacterium RBG_13_60_9]